MSILLFFNLFLWAQQLTPIDFDIQGIQGLDKPKNKIEVDLAKISDFDSKKYYKLCFKQSEHYLKTHKKFQAWVYIKYLDCLSKSNLQSNSFVSAFDKLKTIDGHANWFLTPSAEKRLTQALGSYLLSAVKYFSSKDQKQTLYYINLIESHRSWVSDKDYADALFLTAKSFPDSKNNLSQEYAQKSLSIYKQTEVENYLKTFDKKVEDQKLIDKQIIVDKEQKKILDKMSEYNRAKKWSRLMGIVLTWNEKFPVSDYANRLNAYIYRAFYNSFEVKSRKPKNYIKVINYILKNEPETLASVLEIALKFDKYEAYYELSKLSYEKYPKLKSSKVLLFHYAAASTYTANYKQAVGAYKNLLENFKTAKDIDEIRFKYGLALYRVKNYKQSFKVLAENFEKTSVDPWRLSSLYWAWRSSEKVQSLKSKSTKIKERLMLEYPMTYYGLRARMESTEDHSLTFPAEFDLKTKYTLNLNEDKKNQLQALASFIKSGWYSEASDLIRDIFEPSNPTEKVMTAIVYSQAKNYFNAIRLVADILEKQPELFTKKVLSIAYPSPYLDIIEKYSKAHNLDKHLVLSLIKQESSFDPVAVSPVGAQGLMQIVRITANEIAKDLRVKSFHFPSKLEDPYMNIRFGTYYIKKLLRSNKGHIPMALACYNAGIGNIWRWTRARWDLTKKLENHSSLADDEVWIDELPWIETNYYVKSILRNFLIYKILNNKIYQVNQPVWKSQEM